MRPELQLPIAGGPPLLAAGGEHTGLLRSTLLLHKRRNYRPVVRSLVALLGRTLAVVAAVMRARGTWCPPVALVPMPSSQRRPGRRPVVELVAPLAACLPEVRLVAALVAARSRPPQKGLDAAGRVRNVAGAFAVGRSSLNDTGSVVLVDDVVTTGASMASATGVLTGVERAPVAAIAVTWARVVGR